MSDAERSISPSRSPLPALLRPVGVLVAPIYGAVVSARNRKFDRPEAVARLDVPVISIGNLSVGGTGKTPMVSWVARLLLEHGYRPVIGMRGYGSAPGKFSDEEREHQRRLPEVPVVAHPRRAKALRAFLSEHPEHDVVILDDGFQHRQLARDLDIVLIDATRPPIEDALLPAGWLREPVENLSRADAVVLTRADIRNDDRLAQLERFVMQYHGSPPIAGFCHVWSHLTLADGATEPLAMLARRRWVAVCAIGNPRAFLDMIGMHGGTVAESIVRRDHASFDARTVRRVLQSAETCDGIITTEKDWTRLEPALGEIKINKPIVRPRLELKPVSEAEALKTRILNIMPERAS